jgi:hypothetical protein
VNKLAAILTGLYGLVSILGGSLGAHLVHVPGLAPLTGEPSMISLYAGGGAGLLLLLCAVGDWLGSRFALAGSLIVSLTLLGRFVPAVVKERDRLGEYLMELKGQVAVAMVIGGVLVLLASALAFVQSPRRPANPTAVKP